MTRWHRPGTKAVDRAREVARTCWAALNKVDPEAARTIAWAATQAGETWLVPPVARHQPDDLVSVPEAAELVGFQVRTVYDWISQGRLPRVVDGGRIRVRVGTLHDYVASQQRKTAHEE